MRKPRVVFAFVEAGMGHIMPMQAIYDVFVKKYGDKCEVIKTYFFQDKQNPDMRHVEEEFIKEVKLHNKRRGRGSFHFALLGMFGTRISLKYVMEKRYSGGFKPSIDYIQELNPDLIFNTHFSTLYYSCHAREKKLIDSYIAAYCPDPRLGKQWDTRVDLIGISSKLGKIEAEKRRFIKGKIVEVPFLIRPQVEEFDKGRRYYRKELGIPEENFTILLADGAYGAGKLRDTVYGLLKLRHNVTILAVCGKNEKLYNEFLSLKVPPNITFVPYGFTDKMLMLSACCDIFIGKAGASNLAEPCYFGAPQIINFTATPLEKWIAKYYTKYVRSAVLIRNINKVVKTVEEWIEDGSKMMSLKKACMAQHRTDGPEMLADILWEKLMEKLYSRKKAFIFTERLSKV